MSWFHTHSWRIVSVSHVPRATNVKIGGGEFSGPAHVFDEFMERQRKLIEEMSSGKTIIGMRCQTCGDFKTETHLGIYEITEDPS